MARPASSAAAPSFAARPRPRGRRGSAALTIAIIASGITVFLGVMITGLFGFVFGPSSSMRQTLDPTTLFIAESIVGAPAFFAGLVAHFISQELKPDDEGYHRGRVSWQMAFATAVGAPLLSAFLIRVIFFID